MRGIAQAPRTAAPAPAPAAPSFRIGAVDDAAEREADAAAERVLGGVLRRKCAACEEEERRLSRAAAGSGAVQGDAPQAVQAALAEPGRPLPAAEAGFFGPRLGAPLGGVRLHEGPAADRAARSVGARAFALGSDIVFARGQYRPGSAAGRHLLAHELAHVAQDAAAGTLRRSVMPAGGGWQDGPGGERPLPFEPFEPVPEQPPPRPRRSRPPSPEACPPPPTMACDPGTSSPGSVVSTIVFPVNSWALTPTQQAEISSVAAAWHAAGGGVPLRVDGYASAEGPCAPNWELSCRRAEAVRAELEAPADGSPGVPAGDLEHFAHGENDEAGPTLAPNRRATIDFPVVPPPDPEPDPDPEPACALPVELGHARGCGGGTDFTHYDFPSISTRSAAKLAAWAAARPLSRGPFRSLVTDTECELEMDAVLTGLAGGAGHAAYARFAAGTGGTVTHGPSSTLGGDALASPSFLLTVAAVQGALEAQLGLQASSGAYDPCALSVTPPATHFGFLDSVALKTVIGGTQGERVFLDSFSGNAATRTYSMTLRFVICDDFGVDESDLYFHGLYAFWVLQHERSPSLYVPFINELELPVSLSGTV